MAPGFVSSDAGMVRQGRITGRQTGKDGISYRFVVATIEQTTTFLILRCDADGEMYAAIERVADDSRMG
jgi:hypothetical protein